MCYRGEKERRWDINKYIENLAWYWFVLKRRGKALKWYQKSSLLRVKDSEWAWGMGCHWTSKMQ